MSLMTHRERVLAALNHEETDRVPMDLSGTLSTSLFIPAYENLKKYLGNEHQTQIGWMRQQLVKPDDSILEKFDIDTRPLLLGNYKGGSARHIDENTMVDIWGTTWRKEVDGHYLDVDGPFVKKEPEIKLPEAHDWPDPDNEGLYEGLKERAETLRKTTDFAIVLDLGIGIVTRCQFVRGFLDFLIDLIKNPQFAVRLMNIVADIWIRVAENALEEVGHNVGVVFWGDDYGMQQGPLMRPQIFRDLVKPVTKRMVDAAKSKNEVKVLFHSCGSVFDFIEDFVEIGIDALNPVQIRAHHMEPEKLKDQFGKKISFWGDIDTQHVLPFGTPQAVRAEVRRIIDCMAKGGGYVLASVHNIQRKVPAENIVAMFEEGRSYWHSHQD